MRRYIILSGKSHDKDEYHEDRHHTHVQKSTVEEYHDRMAHSSMAEIKERLEFPPTTWATYAGHPGEDMTIVDMENQELIKARNSGTKAQVRKELTDLAAACVKALNEM